MKKLLMRLIVMGSVLVLLTGCGKQAAAEKPAAIEEPVSVEIFAMDTYMTLLAYGEHADEGLKKAEEEIRLLESLWSVTQEDSEIAVLNKNKTASVSDDTKSILTFAKQVSAQVEQTFDVTVFPIVKAWGFTTGAHRIPDETELAVLTKYVDSDQIKIEGNQISLSGTNAEVDLGAIAKGYTSEKMKQVFLENGITAGIVSLGGNVQTLGVKPNGTPWKVAIQDPFNTDDYIAVIEIGEKAVITSGSYQRYFERDGVIYHHLIDPKTGYPVCNGMNSVTIVADVGTLADALSTAMFVMGKEKALAFWRQQYYNFEMIIIEKDGSITITEGLSETFLPVDKSTTVQIAAHENTE